MGRFNLSKGVRALHAKLARSIVILDSCWLGDTLERFRKLSGALAVAVGFDDEVDWVDSSMFVLAILCRLHQEDVLSLKRTRPRSKTVITKMINGPYSSLAESLSVQTAFR